MLSLLILLPSAHAACAVDQHPVDGGVSVLVRALEEPVHCRTVTLQSDQPLTVKAYVWSPEERRQRLGPEHLRLLPGGGWEIGAPELLVGGRMELVAAVPGEKLTVQLAPASPVVPQVLRLDEVDHLELDPRHPGWGFADPKRARTHVERHYQLPGAAQLLPLPDGATEVDAGGLEVVPLGVRVPAGASEATVRFTLAGAAPQGDEILPPGSLTLDGPGVEWVPSAGPGVSVVNADGVLRFDTETGGVARWRVARAGGAAVIPDVATFVAGLDWRFARLSLPEPAVPMSLRGRNDRTGLLAQLLDEVRALDAGSLPGADPLHPRQLNGAWRSGWATNIERGLILHRFLGQEKYPAGWVLTGAEADATSLTGFDSLLVTTSVGGETVWIDPSCGSCAKGEISTRLLGRPAIGAASQVPTATGRLERSLALRGEEFHASFVATGAAALWLREQISGVEPGARTTRLAAALGMPDGRVGALSGFETAGAPITVELDGPHGPRDPFPGGEPPWTGGWGDTLPP